ncbi:MAG TPA: UbiD family decarboxylase, partial [Nitrososphaerales archaeon]|nr:UbiD family decarboxylase [Nitrososphaerales archaeon]
MRYYADLRDYLKALESAGKLFRVKRPIKKETELSSLVKLQYRGLPEASRIGFLFEDVRSVSGRKYAMPVAAGIYSSSREIYALGLKCEPTNKAIEGVWQRGQQHPIEPTLVKAAPVQEVVSAGVSIKDEIEGLPVPVEIPGFSGQIRTTTQFVTKDPKTGVRNVGNYSGHIYGPTKIQWEIVHGNHGRLHLNAWKALGHKTMPAAIVIGAQPAVFFTAAAKIPYGVDELAVAGGMAGQAIRTVKCKTVDLEVPADAETIIEGEVSTEVLEPGGSFGEYTGYMATETTLRPLFNVTCVTHRKNPIYVHVMSQFPPSESSVVRRISLENVYLKFLSSDCKIPGIMDVAWNETAQGMWCVIKVNKTTNAQPWQVLQCASGYEPLLRKYFVVVDQDIDPRDIESVLWALAWRVQPSRDVRIIQGKLPGLDPSAARPEASYEEKAYPGGVGGSAMLIDATLKYPYPPVSLPKKEYMDSALGIWKELGLPDLSLREPWYGYSLGYWPDVFQQDADQVVRGEHY